MQLQSSLTCRDVVKKKCGNSNCQSDTFIKPSSKMPDHGGGGRGIPQNESEAVEYLQKNEEAFLFCQRFLF